VKLARALLAFFTVVVLAAGAALVWLAGTEAGLRFALERAQSALPVTLDPAAAEGSLVGPLRLPAVTWQDAGVRVAVRGLELDWRPLELLRRRVELDHVHAGAVVVELPAAPTSAAEPGASGSGAGLPWPLSVDRLRVKSLSIQQEDSTLVAELAVGLAGSLEGGRLQLEQFRLEHPRLAVEGSAGGSLDLAEPLAAEFDWQAPYEGQTWAGQARLEGPVADLALELELASPVAARIDGRLQDLTGVPAWDLGLLIESLPADGPWPSQLAGLAGGLRFAGRQTERGFSGRIGDLDLQLRGSRFSGGGAVAWEDGPEIDLALLARDVNPGAWHADWPGRLAGALTLQTVPREPGAYRVRLESLEGELRGLGVNGEAGIDLDNSGAAQIDSRLVIAGSVVSVAGRVARDAVDLDAALVADDLGSLLAGASGKVEAQGRIEGAIEAPAVAIAAQGRALQWRGLRGRVAELRAELDLSGRETSMLHLDVAGTGPRVGRGTRLQVIGTGTPAAHDIRLEFSRRRPEQDLTLALTGGLLDHGWQGALREAEITERGEPLWQLSAPATAGFTDGEVSLSGACLDGIFGLMCIDASSSGAGPWQARGTLAGLDLSRLGDWLNLGLQSAGQLTGGILLNADQTGFTALSGGFGLTPGEIRARGETGPPLLAWNGGALEFQGDSARASAALSLLLASEDELKADVSIGWNEADPSLTGTVRSRLSQLSLIKELVPEIAEIGGRTELEAQLSGTLRAPETRLTVALREGRAFLPGLGITPEDIEADLLLAEDMLRFEMSGRSGEGGFRSSGEFDLAASAVVGSASLRGDSLRVIDLPDLRAAVSPDLEFRFGEGRLVVSGSVDMPTAAIGEFSGPRAIRVSPDEVIVGPEAPAKEDKLEIRARIRLTAGPDVEIEASGLNGRVEGDLVTIVVPGSDPRGRGELRVVDGTFAVLGTTLKIETGRLFYDGGPLENPSLEIRAEREADDVTAGAMIRGTLAQPEVSLYSDPPLPRAEVLSYLTLGKGLGELDTTEQGAVNQAANALVLSGGGLVVQDLARRLGFEGLSVSAETGPDETALIVSKYLGSGLYVSYGLGLFDTVDTLRLRYQVNPRLSLEATSGEEEAADIFYTFERD
jgi:translocation and assembly module TamB